jgi:drug/metabolite transporter (DMT)-like permease
MRGGQLNGLARHWKALLGFALLEIIAPWFLLTDAERRITSSMAGLLIAASPIIVVVLGRLLGDAEKMSARRWVGLVLGLTGVGVLAGPQLGGDDPWAIIEVLLTATGYAIAPLIVARKLQDVPALPVTAVTLTFAAILYAPFAVAHWPTAMPSGKVLAALAALALVCTALAFIVFFALIREVGTDRALVFTYLNPAVAVTAGVVFLGEPLTATIIGSFALILCGSVLATMKQPAATELVTG